MSNELEMCMSSSSRSSFCGGGARVGVGLRLASACVLKRSPVARAGRMYIVYPLSRFGIRPSPRFNTRVVRVLFAHRGSARRRPRAAGPGPAATMF